MIHGKKVGVVIPAAGSGSRMRGKLAKQFLKVGDKPILLYTLERFECAKAIDCVVVVVRDEDRNAVKRMVNARHFSKIRNIIGGGRRRQDSVWNGLKELKNHHIDVVLVHDAVRPFLSLQLIHLVAQAAAQVGAAVPAVQLKDTVKLANTGRFVKTTVRRDTLWSVQTPQAFEFALLYKAFRKARRDGFSGTDEASIVERIGAPVLLVEGSYDNIKITTPEDLELAQLIAKRLEL